MNQASQAKINIFNPSETDILKTVMMRLVAPMQLLGSLPSFLEPSILRQMMHNRFAPYKLHLALAQQLEFKNTLEAHGARVILEPPIPFSGAQYTRDVGFAIDDTFFVSRMGTRAREPEVVALKPWLGRFSKVARLDAGHIEGGDVEGGAGPPWQHTRGCFVGLQFSWCDPPRYEIQPGRAEPCPDFASQF